MSTTDTADKLVRYVRNADPNSANGKITFPDARPDLLIGYAGYVSEQEIASAAGYGLVLEATNKSELRELGIPLPEAPEPEAIPLREMPLDGPDGLKALAKAEDADTGGAKTKNDYATAIEKRRALVEGEGQASLPASAGVGPGAPVAASQPAGSGDTTGGQA